MNRPFEHAAGVLAEDKKCCALGALWVGSGGTWAAIQGRAYLRADELRRLSRHYRVSEKSLRPVSTISDGADPLRTQQDPRAWFRMSRCAMKWLLTMNEDPRIRAAETLAAMFLRPGFWAALPDYPGSIEPPREDVSVLDAAGPELSLALRSYTEMMARSVDEPVQAMPALYQETIRLMIRAAFMELLAGAFSRRLAAKTAAIDLLEYTGVLASAQARRFRGLPLPKGWTRIMNNQFDKENPHG